MKINSIKSYADMGDTVYSLLFYKLFKIKNLYLDDSGIHTKFNKTCSTFLLPLLKHQKYMERVEIYVDQAYDAEYCELPATYGRVIPGMNLTQYHLSKFKKDSTNYDLSSPWIESPKIEKNKYKVIINRSERYPGINPKFYETLIKSVYPFDQCAFVGLKNEYDKFVKDFNFNLPYLEAENALDLASIINSCSIFLGNESLACSIATGLGKTCFVEYCPQAANYVFDNEKMFYFGHKL